MFSPPSSALKKMYIGEQAAHKNRTPHRAGGSTLALVRACYRLVLKGCRLSLLKKLHCVLKSSAEKNDGKQHLNVFGGDVLLTACAEVHAAHTAEAQ